MLNDAVYDSIVSIAVTIYSGITIINKNIIVVDGEVQAKDGESVGDGEQIERAQNDIFKIF